MKKWTLIAITALFLSACADETAPEEETVEEEVVTEEEVVEEAAPEEEPVEEAVEEEETVEEETTVEPDEELQAFEEEGFVTQVTAEGFLVNNVFFSVGEETEVFADDGSEVTESALNQIAAGQKVLVEYEGTPSGQFPLEAEAGTITILEDEESARQAAALEAFIQGEELARLAILGQPIVREDEIGFLFTNFENGKIAEVRINLETHEYTIDGEAISAEEEAGTEAETETETDTAE
ncbi:hypothetical protein [Planococcus lenghuensis]|uniref:DUF3221 domain-containing protein n=1 Tax=Planococcus lenghuensis TaxID=2213202 RepID=A0A1Q2KY53_9BACL|nr:hypothetical protein [Planococcus lenghuensis]AQQ53056.1 hypothetical protein B0X71_08090 [Planococcus lenghuensis]